MDQRRHTRSPFWQFLLLPLFFLMAFFQQEAFAGGVQDLDATSRRAVREAQMEQYGAGRGAKSSKQADETQKSPVSITDAIGASGRKKCVVKVGDVISSERLRGARQESITYVDGNIVNVCE